MTQAFKKIDMEAAEKFADELLGYSYRLFESSHAGTADTSA